MTPDELGESWSEGRIHLRLICEVNGLRLGNPDAGADATFGLFELIAHAAKTRDLAAGTMIGTGTISNQDAAAGYAASWKAGFEKVEREGEDAFLRYGAR